ncbi:hypothetical protein PR003_g13295 [Phytophthora rubi]|uniref:RxLR effector protein n=1 Tax=Phytophthora rubi TaxID=129364 RepID=A0A6A3M362_9STRA|nr:hypothetical protein PR002_g12862 [Phytophthora rubi]KAE9024857.1 hypothetical protein PR001_g12561 [Phytophthora rubi]KAE9334881.1 hypothetical protein PR003_g13295 [Phytophthora rubi]
MPTPPCGAALSICVLDLLALVDGQASTRWRRVQQTASPSRDTSSTKMTPWRSSIYR